ncbi:MAG: phosphate ABC transporter substrate-binding protein [Bacillota bacterium]
MNNLRKWSAALLLLSLTLLAGCGGKEEAPNQGGAAGEVSGTVTASGSTALLPLAQAAAEQFQEMHAKVTVNVSGGGSFNGLAQVASGAVQIGNSDVQATGDQAKGLVEFKVAVAPFLPIANNDVAVENLTMEQFARILRGEITNWKEVGGKDTPITVVSRPQSSGSRATIVEKVLKGQGDIAKTAIVQDSNGKVRETVEKTPGAIGYVDAAYYQPGKVKALKLDGVAYSPEAVVGGKWPVYAYEYMYTKGEPTGATKAFLDFVLSKEFQEGSVAKLGFIPITQMTK